MDYKTADLALIIQDAKKNDRVDYLKTLAAKTYKKKDGTKRKASFFEIKKNYFIAFYPEQLPVAKAKKKTMYDLINEL